MERPSLMDSLRLGPGNAARRARRFSDADCASVATHEFLPPDARHLSQKPREDDIADASKTKGLAPGSAAFSRHECSAQSCALATVFETTELVEIILNFLDTADVLSLGRACCRKWRELTLSRPQLQYHLFLLPQWTRPPRSFQLLHAKIEGLTIERGDLVQDGQWIKVRMTRSAAYTVLPHGKPRARVRSRSIFEGLRGGLGPKSRQEGPQWPMEEPPRVTGTSLKHEDLYVCQPPVLGMQAFVRKTSADPGDTTKSAPGEMESVPSAKLHCDAGTQCI